MSLRIAILAALVAAFAVPASAETRTIHRTYAGGNVEVISCPTTAAPSIGGACIPARGVGTLDVSVADVSGSPVAVAVVFDTNDDGFHDLAYRGCGSVAAVPVPSAEPAWDGTAVVLVGNPADAACSAPSVAGQITATLND